MTDRSARRRLAWGPFTIAMVVTLAFAWVGWWLTDLSDGHWWQLPVGAVFAVVTVLLAMSAGLALVERGGSAR